MKNLTLSIIAVIMAFVTVSCNQASNKNEQSSNDTQIGLVPSDEVCMVNDAYMGKRQFEVKFDGKTYYGCCEMCKERIPKDATVRMAIDPYSHKQVDKANAVIAVTGNNGEVSYFKNKENYAKYVKKQ